MKSIHPRRSLEFKFSNYNNFQPCFLNGRSAIQRWIKSLNTNRKINLLVPAYYCGDVLQQLTDVNYIFYDLDSELKPILRDIDILNADSIIICNFFGVTNISIIDTLFNFFDKKNILLDSSHVIMDYHYDIPILYSFRKFFNNCDFAILKNFHVDNSVPMVKFHKKNNYICYLPFVLFKVFELLFFFKKTHILMNDTSVIGKICLNSIFINNHLLFQQKIFLYKTLNVKNKHLYSLLNNEYVYIWPQPLPYSEYKAKFECFSKSNFLIGDNNNVHK